MEVVYIVIGILIVLLYQFTNRNIYLSGSSAVMPPETPKELHLEILKNHLKQLNINNKLIIIDNYLLPKNHDVNYLDFFIEVFKDALKQCNELEIITLEKHNENLKNLINEKMKKLYPDLKVTYKFTNLFHDRFWIADNKKGLFIGTSLNGVGKKYSMIDFLLDEDTEAIVAQLKNI